jgi:AcrR family transcriptional regulator/predicted MFS family arabinose efflux permease
VLGGFLIAVIDWRAIFFVNLPIGLAGIWLAAHFVPDVSPPPGQRMDYLGAGLLGVSLLCLCLGLTLGPTSGPGALRGVALLAAALAAGIGFVVVQLRGPSPLIDLRIFRAPLLWISLIAGLATFAASSAAILLVPFYHQGVMGYATTEIGLLLAVAPLAMGLISPIAGALSDRFGIRLLSLLGLVVLSAAYMGLTLIGETTSAATFAALWIPIGVGMGIFQSPNNSAIMGAAPPQYAGVASGLLTMTRLLGQLTGVAVLGSIWSTQVTVHAGGPVAGGPSSAAATAQVAALHDVFVVATALLAGAAVQPPDPACSFVYPPSLRSRPGLEDHQRDDDDVDDDGHPHQAVDAWIVERCIELGGRRTVGCCGGERADPVHPRNGDRQACGHDHGDQHVRRQQPRREQVVAVDYPGREAKGDADRDDHGSDRADRLRDLERRPDRAGVPGPRDAVEDELGAVDHRDGTEDEGDVQELEEHRYAGPFAEHRCIMEDVSHLRSGDERLSRPERATRRPYRLRARAEAQARTRRRIAEAAVELHGTVGPARTTIRAIAERAGVERVTVYRHFPDERALFAACSGRFYEDHPPPDLARPMAIADPVLRLEAVLLELYRFYREAEPIASAVLRDAAAVPLVRDYLDPYLTMLEQARDALAVGWPESRDARLLRATIGHALAFTTWRSLTLEQGLSDAEAAAVMTAFVRSSAVNAI